MIKKITMLCLSLMVITMGWAQSNNSLNKTEKAGQGIYNKAQDAKDITFPTTDIQFWCGTGSNQGTVIVAWDDMDTPVALVWGVRWNGSAVALDLIDSIATYDSRFTYDFGGSLISNVEYSENGDTYASSTNYWCYYLNGDWAMNAYNNQSVSNNDVIEMSGTCMFDMTTAIAAVDPNASIDTTPAIPDATIASADIHSWVGQGANEAIIAVNWNNPDTCLAWGVRFDTDSITVEQAMDSIRCNDYRFKYIPGAWGISDIVYNDYQGTYFSLTDVENYNYWWSNYNGTAAFYSYDVQTLVNGDIFKWGDPTCGIVLDTMWGYPSEIVWTTTVTPATVITAGPFCGIVGTEGCNAVHYSDTNIKGWASACTLNLGHYDIADPDSPIVSYGSAEEAVGAVVEGNLAVVSLGDGGTATLSFDHPIVNGEGYDFAVFENSFNDSFLELAFVEVSTDGENFVRFPSTSLTSSCANVGGYGGIDATFIDNLAGKYRTGYGTPFDLEQLRDSANINIDSIMFVRIVDVVGSVAPEYATYDQFGNIVVDPYPTNSYSSGFDLDGVAVLNWNYTNTEEPESISDIALTEVKLFPNPANSQVVVNVKGEGLHIMTLYDMTGRQIEQTSFEGAQMTINTASLTNGIYMVRIDGNAQRLVIRH